MYIILLCVYLPFFSCVYYDHCFDFRHFHCKVALWHKSTQPRPRVFFLIFSFVVLTETSSPLFKSYFHRHRKIAYSLRRIIIATRSMRWQPLGNVPEKPRPPAASTPTKRYRVSCIFIESHCNVIICNRFDLLWKCYNQCKYRQCS